jgi:hypothetical protein
MKSKESYTRKEQASSPFPMNFLECMSKYEILREVLKMPGDKNITLGHLFEHRHTYYSPT